MTPFICSSRKIKLSVIKIRIVVRRESGKGHEEKELSGVGVTFRI